MGPVRSFLGIACGLEMQEFMDGGNMLITNYPIDEYKPNIAVMQKKVEEKGV